MLETALVLFTLAATPPADSAGLSDAPLVQADEPMLSPASPPTASGLMAARAYEDPYRNSWRSGEVAAAAAGVVLADALSLGIGFGVGLALCQNSCNTGDSSPIGMILVMGFVSALADVALTPLFATVFAHWWSDPSSAGTVGRSLGYAFAATGLQAAMLVVALVIPAVAPVCLALALALHVVGIPLAASAGLHSASTEENPVLAASRGVPVMTF